MRPKAMRPMPAPEPKQIPLFDVSEEPPARLPSPAFSLPDSPAALPRQAYLVWRALKAYGSLPLSVEATETTAAAPRGVLSIERVMLREHGYTAPAVARAVQRVMGAGYVTLDNGVYTAHDTREVR